jgi:integrase
VAVFNIACLLSINSKSNMFVRRAVHCVSELYFRLRQPPASERSALGLYRRSDSRFWWMSYTMNGEQYHQSTKTTSKELANSVLKQRESEIVMGLFKLGWAGKRMTFEQLVEEFERAHFAGLSENTIKGHRVYLAHLKSLFGMRKVSAITVEMVEDYRDQRRLQPAKRNPQRTIKGATVNRELECLKCVLDLAVKRKYIRENPAAAVKHFNELRERPVRRMLTVDEEIRIVESAPPYLRVAIVLLSQTGGRTYSEGLSLRWDQVDFDQRLIRLDHNVKTEGSVAPIPLSEFACAVLQAWQKALGSRSPYVFPSPKNLDRPISTVKTAWKGTLKRAGVPHFSIYTLRHVFCTRLSAVAPDAVVQRAMRHTSPETKRIYQLGMTVQVREAVEKSNERAYGEKRVLRFYDVLPVSGEEEKLAVSN